MAGENLVRPKGFKAWCENFWYHYKFYTIVAIFAVITLVVAVAQCSTKTKYDYKIILATTTVEMASPQIAALEEQLALYGEDLNGDGEVNLTLVDCTINEYTSMRDTAMAKRQKLQSLLMNDTEVMMIVSDGACFEWINETLGGNFIENTDLPDKGGMAFELDGTPLYEKAKDKIKQSNLKDGIAVELVWPEGLNISRRTVKGTLLEDRDGVEESVKNADAFIQRVISHNSTKK